MADVREDSISCKQITVGQTERTAGRVGRNAMFETFSDVKLGGWFNAAKAQMDFGSAGTGEITGAASAFNSEMILPNKTTTGGSYTSLEVNLHFQANTVLHNNPVIPTSLAKFKIDGDNAAMRLFEDNPSACLFQIDGFDGGDGSVVDTNGAAGAIDGALKINIDGTPWYIAISSTT